MAKNASGSLRLEANNLRSVAVFFPVEGMVKLIDCNEFKNCYISGLFPEALAWNRIN